MLGGERADEDRQRSDRRLGDGTARRPPKTEAAHITDTTREVHRFGRLRFRPEYPQSWWHGLSFAECKAAVTLVTGWSGLYHRNMLNTSIRAKG